MSYIILVRLESGDVVGIDKDLEGNLEEFPSIEEAHDLADAHLLTKTLPYQIVELDEL